MIDLGGTGNLVFLPKVGASITVTIVGSKSVQTTEEKLSFKTKKEGVLGYYYECELSDGKKLVVNNWAARTAMIAAQIEYGETIVITHPGTGKYEVKKTAPASFVLDSEDDG